MVRSLLVVLFVASACPPPPAADTEPPKPKEDAPRVNEGRVVMPDATPQQICADDCLLLTRYDVHTLKHRFKDLCCTPDLTPDDPRCETGVWPFAKDQPCKGWKRLEMCVYAKHGYVFKEDSEWKPVFENEPWYRPSGTFTASEMTIMVKRNTLSMRGFESGGVDCAAPTEETAPE